MTVTIVTDGEAYSFTDPEEIRIKADSIVFEADREAGHQIYVYHNSNGESQKEKHGRQNNHNRPVRL